jgi:tRNA pseudouridine55 synthase
MPSEITGDYFLLYKPIGWTSFQLVKKIKHLIKKVYPVKEKIKVGHAGTLDPLAEGLMIICFGSYTKKIQEFQSLPKTYEGIFHLGATTPSYDLEHPVDKIFPIEHITEDLILETARKFTGQIFQTPPEYSAVKVDGKRSYQLMRDGKIPELREKLIEIYSFEILSCQLPEVHFRVKCSKGTYIRALARDFGTALKSGAYLKKLLRTHIGNFSIQDAWHEHEWETKIQNFFQNEIIQK